MKYKVVFPMHPGLEVFDTGHQKINVTFPQGCVYCDGPVETHQLIDLSGGATVGKQSVSFSTQLIVPYCLDHSIVFNKYKKLMKVIGFPLFLVVFLGWFAVMLPFGDLVGKYLPGINIIMIPLIFPCIGNLIVAFFFLILLHGLLLLFNPKFREIPFITENGGLGIKIKMNVGMYAINDLTFTFTNQDYAKEFAELNNVPLS